VRSVEPQVGPKNHCSVVSTVSSARAPTAGTCVCAALPGHTPSAAHPISSVGARPTGQRERVRNLATAQPLRVLYSGTYLRRRCCTARRCRRTREDEALPRKKSAGAKALRGSGRVRRVELGVWARPVRGRHPTRGSAGDGRTDAQAKGDLHVHRAMAHLRHELERARRPALQACCGLL